MFHGSSSTMLRLASLCFYRIRTVAVNCMLDIKKKNSV